MWSEALIQKKANDQFKIGERNLQAVRAILRSRGLQFIEDSTGDNLSRTVALEMKTGNLTIKTQDLDF